MIDHDNIPTAAEAERDAPTAAEVAHAIRERGPAPVVAADFGSCPLDNHNERCPFCNSYNPRPF